MPPGSGPEIADEIRAHARDALSGVVTASTRNAPIPLPEGTDAAARVPVKKSAKVATKLTCPGIHAEEPPNAILATSRHGGKNKLEIFE